VKGRRKLGTGISVKRKEIFQALSVFPAFFVLLYGRSSSGMEKTQEIHSIFGFFFILILLSFFLHFSLARKIYSDFTVKKISLSIFIASK